MIVAFEEKGTMTVKMNFDRRDIIRRYLHGWFLLDCLCAVPLDLLTPSLTTQHSTTQIHTNPLRAVRMIRLFRIFKISRLQILSRIDLPFTVVTLIKCLFLSCLCAHWVACLW